MSNFQAFMKKNKRPRKNSFYPATRSLLDENGEPLLWEIRPLTTAEDERIRERCTSDALVPGSKNVYRSKVDLNRYLVAQMAAAIVTPDLYNAELQDSYGVKTPEDLLRELVDDPAEFAELGAFIREHSGFETDMNQEIEAAKN